MKTLFKLIFLFVIMINTHAVFASENISKIKEVASRIAPWLSGSISTEYISPEGGLDVYELSSKGHKIHIKASSVPAAGMALNHYLKYYCNRNFGLVGCNMLPVDKLPLIDKPIRKHANVEYRHIFNFCTQSYSAAFWKWADWEKAIDYMVLNGVNLTLVPMGLEKVWYNTLKQFKFSHSEILEFLPGPAFSAWHMMANLEGWGGPISLEYINQRCEMEQRVVKRLKSLGIEPIHMAFYGMVPTKLHSKFPDAEIKDQGNWVGGFKRPSVLIPGQKLYNDMADVYYREMRKLYGEINYFAGEPFHEGGKRDGIKVEELSKKVFEKMRQYNPKARWVLQGWSGNPTQAFLSTLPKDGMLIWDFRGELSAEWEASKGYYGHPFMWGVINNYGETPGLYGQLERFNNEYFRAKRSPYSSFIKGLSVASEGILNNPVNFDFLYELVWNDAPVDLNEWIRQYVKFRYGRADSTMENIWQILLATAYSSKTDPMNIDPISNTLPSIVGNSESVMAASPQVDLVSASSWGTNKPFYNTKKMRVIIPMILESLQKHRDVDAYQYDIVNITRQLISNEFRHLYYEVNTAIKNDDLAKLNQYSVTMLELITQMDNVLSSHASFMLGNWIKQAQDLGTNQDEKSLFEWSARAQISFWGSDNIRTDLRDYAHKEWGGLTKDLHYPRWKAFFDFHKNRIKGVKTTKLNNTLFAQKWSRESKVYPATPQLEFNSTIQDALQFLQQTIDEYNPLLIQ